MACEENVLDIPLDASAIDPDEVVIFTKPDGTSVIRRASMFSAATVRSCFDWVGADGTVLNTGITNIPIESIISISRTGREVRNIIDVPPTGEDVQWDEVTGDLTAASTIPFTAGEYIVIVRIA